MSGRVGIALYGVSHKAGKTRLQTVLHSKRHSLQCIIDKDLPGVERYLDEVMPPLDRNTRPLLIKPWNWDVVCTNPCVSGIWLCSPVPTINMVRRALKCGKAILYEKPLSLQSAAVRACFEVAASMNTHLVHYFNRRQSAVTQAVGSRLQLGEIGRIQSIQRRVRPPLHLPNVSMSVSSLSEEVDALCWLLSDTPSTVQAVRSQCARTDGAVDQAELRVTLNFASGCTARVNIARDSPGENEAPILEVFGSAGTLVVHAYEGGNVVIHTVNSSGSHCDVIEQEQPEHRATEALNHFTDVIHGSDKAAISETDILRATYITAAAMRAVQQDNGASVAVGDFMNDQLWKEDPDSYNGRMPSPQTHNDVTCSLHPPPTSPWSQSGHNNTTL